MAPFFDQAQINDALRYQAIPTLASLAANPSLHNRSLKRFERDEPPPYVSSSESEVPEHARVRLPRYDEIPDHLRATLERPLDDREQTFIASSLSRCLFPFDAYLTEARVEERRVRHYRPHKDMVFVRRGRPKAIGVMVRHNIKRRWQKLGIWNSEWGFPGRNVQPRDEAYEWKWRWDPEQSERKSGDDNRQGSASAQEEAPNYNLDLVLRALQRRRNLRRGEAAPVLPRSHPGEEVTDSEGESFLLSRPWFIFRLERAEERMRYFRLDAEERERLPQSAGKQVIEWWKERGDWKDEFNAKGCVTSWKWRHESPSPEPEDLSAIDKMEESPLDAVEEMDFSPSEIEDLETIELPDHEQPEGFWLMSDDEGGVRGTYPGETLDLAKQGQNRLRRWTEMYGHLDVEPKSPPSAHGLRLFGPVQVNRAGQWDAVQQVEKSTQDDIHGPRDAKSRKSLAQKLPRQRGRRQRDEANGIPDSSQCPPLRRSARIAAMKRPAEPMVSQAESRPKKKPRTRETTTITAKPKPKPKAKAAVATAPTSSRKGQRPKTKPLSKPPPQNKEAGSRSTRGRGHSTKDSKARPQTAKVKKQPSRGAQSR